MVEATSQHLSLDAATAQAKSSKQHREKQSFTTVANLITTLLVDLEQTYVQGNTKIDKKMKKRISTSIAILNSNQEVSNLIIKGDPFHSHHSDSKRTNSARS